MHLTHLFFDKVASVRTYHLCWKDRQWRDGSAVMYIDQSLPFTEVVNDSTLEFIACKVEINSMYDLVFSLLSTW